MILSGIFRFGSNHAKKSFAIFCLMSSFLTLGGVFSVAAQTRNAKEWSIADYVNNLPEKYITASGDFVKPSVKTIIVDEKNGWAVAHTDFPPNPNALDAPFAVFQMALFKSRAKPPLVVVSNFKSDEVCDEYETFFLRRVGAGWTEIKQGVLPAMNLKMFWDAPKSAERLVQIIKANAISYHFEPPRQGTRMKVSLEICDYVADGVPTNELEKLVAAAKPIYLVWDKQNGRFNFAKE